MKLKNALMLMVAAFAITGCGKTSTDQKSPETTTVSEADNVITPTNETEPPEITMPDAKYIERIVLDASEGGASHLTKDFRRVAEQRSELPRIWWDMQFGNLNYPYNGGDIDCGMLTGVRFKELDGNTDSRQASAIVLYTLTYEYGDSEENTSEVKLRFEDGEWRIDDFGFPIVDVDQPENNYYYIKSSFSETITQVNNDIAERYDDILANILSEAKYDPTNNDESKLNNYIKKYNIKLNNSLSSR